MPPEIPLLGEDDGFEAPPPEPTGRVGRSVLIGLAAFGALWVVAALLAGQSGSETTAAAAPTATVVATPTATPEPTPAPTLEPTPEVEPEPEVEAAASRATGASIDAGIRMLQGHLERSEQDATIMYRSGDAVTFVDLRSGDVQVADMGGIGSGDLSQARLLQSGDDTIVVDPDARGAQIAPGSIDQIILNSSTGIATVLDEDGTFVVLGADGPPVEHRLPEGAEVLAVADYAFIVITEDGASKLVTPGGFEHLSDHRVLTATPSAHVELRCENFLECVLAIVHEDREAILPPSFSQIGDRYLLSPDGAALVRWDTSGRGEIHVPEDSYTTILGSGVEHPVWSADSSFVSWLDLETEPPRLKTLLYERREWMLWDVATMGAPEPSGSELLIW